MTVLQALGVASMAFVAVFTWHAYRKPAGAGQSPREAILEAWLSLALGFAITASINPLLIPLMAPGGHVTLAANWWGGWCYTAVSLARQYSVRRWAAENIHRLAARLSRLIP